MILEKFEINPVLMYDTLRKPSSSFQLEQDELEIGVSPSWINFFFWSEAFISVSESFWKDAISSIKVVPADKKKDTWMLTQRSHI